MRRGGRHRVRAAAIAALSVVITTGGAEAQAAAPKAKPKLSVYALQLAPSTAAPGASFAIVGKVRNRGGRRNSPAVVQAFIGAGGDRSPIGKRSITVAARDSRAFTLEALVPHGTPPGVKDVTVCVRRRLGGRNRCRRARQDLSVSAVRTSDPSPGPIPEPPGPGPRTLGDPLFPEVGNGGYDVKHYDVEINWAPPDNFQAGTETTVTAEATQTLSELSLDFEGLAVGDVDVDGVDATSFSREAPAACSAAPPCPPTKLVITPATPIAAGDEFTVRVAYTGDPQRHTDPDGSDEGWADTADGAFVVNEPVGAMTWMPCNNHPLDRATYDFELTVPALPTGRIAIGNGELIGQTSDLLTTTWHWASDATLPTYLSTSSIGFFNTDFSTTATGLPLYDFLDVAFAGIGFGSLDDEESMIDFFSARYGPYPFDSAGAVVDNAPTIGYALEVQTKPHFPLAPVDNATLAHEVAHQWFGNSVTLTTWKDIWLNEGWATWSQWEWDFRENAEPSPADQFNSNYTPGTKWDTAPANPTAAGLFETFPVYTRPAMMLEALNQIIGDLKFFELAQEWHASNRHGHGTTAEFIALAKQKSGFSGAELTKLDQFFQQWLFGTSMPTITGANF